MGRQDKKKRTLKSPTNLDPSPEEPAVAAAPVPGPARGPAPAAAAAAPVAELSEITDAKPKQARGVKPTAEKPSPDQLLIEAKVFAQPATIERLVF